LHSEPWQRRLRGTAGETTQDGGCLRVAPLRPDRDDAAATDQVTEDLLRMLGVPADEAHEICRRLLPDLDGVPLRDTAG